MTTFTTTVQYMFTLPQVDGHTDVVVTVFYNVSGTDGVYTAYVELTNQYTVQQGGTFTPYDQLTEAQVVSWIPQDQLTNAQANVQSQLNSMANPPIVPTSQSLPWEAPTLDI
jgi:hypothetical protein